MVPDAAIYVGVVNSCTHTPWPVTSARGAGAAAAANGVIDVLDAHARGMR